MGVYRNGGNDSWRASSCRSHVRARMTVRLLATGDIHIGRRPMRIRDAELAERASAARMWEDIVSRAVFERADVVLLSRDIVDHDNRFYEATGPLE